MTLAHIRNHWSKPPRVISTIDRPVGGQATEKHRVGRCRAYDGIPPSSGLSRPPEGLVMTFEPGAMQTVICRIFSALIRKAEFSARPKIVQREPIYAITIWKLAWLTMRSSLSQPFLESARCFFFQPRICVMLPFPRQLPQRARRLGVMIFHGPDASLFFERATRERIANR